MIGRGKILLSGVLAWLLVSVTTVFAVTPDEMLADPALEARAREISQHLRCVVCPNQSIDDSNAPLAKDLRILIRDRLKAGDSDAETRAFVVERYGNFVLLRPPFQLNTLLLWLAPVLLGLGVLYMLLRFLRHQQSISPDDSGTAVLPASTEDLSEEETQRLREILEKGSTS